MMIPGVGVIDESMQHIFWQLIDQPNTTMFTHSTCTNTISIAIAFANNTTTARNSYIRR